MIVVIVAITLLCVCFSVCMRVWHGFYREPCQTATCRPVIIGRYGVVTPLYSKHYRPVSLFILQDSLLARRATALYDSLADAGLGSEVVLEDRHHLSQSAKLKDAYLVGYPFVVVVGKEAEQENKYELQRLQCKQVVTQKLSLDELIREMHLQTSLI